MRQFSRVVSTVLLRLCVFLNILPYAGIPGWRIVFSITTSTDYMNRILDPLLWQQSWAISGDLTTTGPEGSYDAFALGGLVKLGLLLIAFVIGQRIELRLNLFKPLIGITCLSVTWRTACSFSITTEVMVLILLVSLLATHDKSSIHSTQNSPGQERRDD